MYLTLGLRNLWCNPRRTLVMMTSLLIGFAALTCLGALSDGLAVDMRQNFILTLQGHVQVHRKGFIQTRQLQDHIADPDVVYQVIAEQPDVASWTSRVRASGLAAARLGGTTTGVEILGVDLEREVQVSRLSQFVVRGQWLSTGDQRGLLMGSAVVDRLGIDLGDRVLLMTRTAAGRIAPKGFALRGVLQAGVPQVDWVLAVMPLEAAQRLFRLGQGVTDIVIRATHDEATDRIREALQDTLSEAPYEVQRWWDASPILQRRLELNAVTARLVLFIVVLALMLQSLSTMLIALHERTYELGLMAALGVRKGQLFLMILWESTILAMSGAAAGYLLGALTVLYMGRHGLDLSKATEALNFVYLSPIIHPVLTWQTGASILGTALAATLLAAIYPTWKATRIEPVAALHAH